MILARSHKVDSRALCTKLGVHAGLTAMGGVAAPRYDHLLDAPAQYSRSSMSCISRFCPM